MTIRLNRRNYLLGTAAFAAVASMPRLSFGQELAYKGDLNMYSLVRTPPDQALADLIASFEVAHPGISIKTTSYPSESFVALLTAAQQAGENIDVLFLNGQDLRRYAVDGTLLELDGKLDTDRFRPGALKTAQVNGKTYGAPYSAISGFPLLTNAKILEDKGLSAPKSYADLLAIRDALQGSGIKTFTHPGKNIYLWPVWFFTTFGQTSGNRSNERTAEILSGKAKFTDDDVVQGLDLVFQFGRDQLLTQEIFSMDTPQAMAEFAAGRALFWMHHESAMNELATQDPANLKLDVNLMPKLVDADVRSNYPGGPSAIVSAAAKAEGDRQAAAVAFIDWITTDEANVPIVKFNNGTVPANKAVSAEGGPVVDKLLGLSDGLVTYLDWNWPPEITRVFQEGIQAGVAGQGSAQEVASTAQTTLERLVSNGYTFQV
jgi:raffinose/stachyose/melibiose transport system substrate-binding protein